MPQAAQVIHGLKAVDIHESIRLLINNLVNIKDETGHFLLVLPDGRVIDTKGWNDWEWTHGVGNYSLEIRSYTWTNTSLRPVRLIPILHPLRIQRNPTDNRGLVSKTTGSRNDEEHKHNVALPDLGILV